MDPARPLFLFAPGAGASSSHPWMRRWAELLAPLGTVTTLDYDYVKAGRRGPDPLRQLIAAHASALAQARTDLNVPVILIGKSMGSRIGCYVSIHEKIDALVCLGYPLCGGGDRSKLRDKVLREISAPILFVQGTRDPLSPLDLLNKIRGEMRAASELYVVEGGDHSLHVSKRRLNETGETQPQVESRVIEVIRDFVAREVALRGPKRTTPPNECSA
ncbi:MAG: alpha/beta family hydrolase [Chthoniobacterales bacterium]